MMFKFLTRTPDPSLIAKLNEAERKALELDKLAVKFKQRADRLAIDNAAMEAEIAANARFVEVGKARLASLEKQKAKARREVA